MLCAIGFFTSLFSVPLYNNTLSSKLALKIGLNNSWGKAEVFPWVSTGHPVKDPAVISRFHSIKSRRNSGMRNNIICLFAEAVITLSFCSELQVCSYFTSVICVDVCHYFQPMNFKICVGWIIKHLKKWQSNWRGTWTHLKCIQNTCYKQWWKVPLHAM